MRREQMSLVIAKLAYWRCVLALNAAGDGGAAGQRAFGFWGMR